MNTPEKEVPMGRRSAFWREDWWEMQKVETIRVLLVGPDGVGDVVHDELSEGLSSMLLGAANSRHLCTLPMQEPIRLAVLHHALSSLELEDVTRTIRQRWPRARILVIREGEDFLDDALYDDHVAPPTTAGALLATIRNLLSRMHE